MKRRLILTCILILSILMVACRSDYHYIYDRNIIISGEIAYITEDNRVCFISQGGISGFYPKSFDAKALFDNWQVLIVLKNDGSVVIYSTETHEPIDSDYCRKYVIENRDSDTGNGTIGEYAELCSFFEEHTKVEDVLYWNNSLYAAKINGVWEGPLVDNYPDFDFSGVIKITGDSYPILALKEDGTVVSIEPSGNLWYQKLVKAGSYYVDIVIGYDNTFYLDKAGNVYSVKSNPATEWKGVQFISADKARSIVGIDDKGNLLFQSNYSRFLDETGDWKNMVYVYNGGDYLIGVDQCGNLRMTSQIKKYYETNFGEMPKVKVKR